MKKFFLTALMFLAIGVTSCVKDDPYVEPEQPEIPDSELKGNLVLNEINGSGADEEKYIELYNNSDKEIDLKGIVIYYNNVSSEPAITWTGTNQKIASKSFLLLKGSKGSGDLSTGLSGSQGINVEIRDAMGERVDQFQVPAETGRVKSYARIPDGIGGWYYDDPAGTPATTNGTSTTGKAPIESVPVISDLSRSVDAPTPTDDVEISAKVVVEEGTTLTSVVLKWLVNGEAKTAIIMTATGDTYKATISKQANGAEVAYEVVATNNKGGTATSGGNYTVTDGSVATKGKVYINECDPDQKKWELYNAEDFEINLGGWKMIKDNDAEKPFTFEAGTTIPAKGFLVLTQNEPGSPTFGMSAVKGFKYDLFNAESETVNVFDNFEENQFNNDIQKGYTVGRVTDGAENLITFSTGSIGKSNSEGVPAEEIEVSALVINEIDGNGKFVELYNNSDEEISLTGVTLIKNEDKKKIWWTGGADTKIGAKKYYSIAQEGSKEEGADEYTGIAGISPKQLLKFELESADGEVLDTFTRSGKGDEWKWGDGCTPDYKDSSFSRCPNGTGDFGLATPSINKANPATATGAIIVD